MRPDDIASLVNGLEKVRQMKRLPPMYVEKSGLDEYVDLISFLLGADTKN